MLQIRAIPCLLYDNGGLVKTIKFKNPKYIGDPINAVKIFNDKEVDELVFLDINTSEEKRRPNFKLISEIASECFMPVGYGGGIREIDDIQKIFSLGIEKVIINTYAVEKPEFIKKAADRFGNQSIVVSVDVKKDFFGKYKIYTYGGKKKNDLDIVFFAKQMQEMGAGELIINSIDRDGTMLGYDLNLLKMVTAATNIPIVALGGAGNLDDFNKAIHEGGVSAVAAGSFFVFYGPHRAFLINYPSAKELEKLSN